MAGSPNKQAATLNNVASSASAVALFGVAGNSVRRTIFNDSSSACYIALGGTASITRFTNKVAAGGYFEFPLPLYGGTASIIWDTANGFARTTEY
jgi:hypothetical protein